MRSVLASLLLLSVFAATAQVNVIPKPATVRYTQGSLKLSRNIHIVYQEYFALSAEYLCAYLKNYAGVECTIGQTSANAAGKDIIKLSLVNIDEPVGSYVLSVSYKGIEISGHEEGIFNGVQTLIQLLPTQPNANIVIPYLQIIDEPRFRYRGMHLDVSRHFFPVSFVKKYIDYLALHKLNYFHWHLTDDQGWRIEIKKYPRLTSVGGYRNGTIIGRFPGTGNDGLRYGGFYTQEEVKEVVKYAADRYITVLPEIEMPGHASAAIAAYPELSCFPEKSTRSEYPERCAWAGDTTGKQVQQTWGVFDDVFCAGKDNTFNFLQDVLDEVIPLFPSRIIHVGGDECPKTHWKVCPNCQKRMKENNLKDEHHLQSYFIQRMEKYLNSKGKTLIGWDEILEGGLAPNAQVMSWRGEEGGIAAAKQKHYVVMSPTTHVYFDYTQSESEDSVTIGGFNPIEKVYAYDPQPKELTAEEQKYIMGGQANLWSEYLKNERKVEYMIFPRMSALSEILWSPKASRNWKDFEKRLSTQFKRYDLWKVNYSRALFDLKAAVLPSKNNTGLLWQVRSKTATNMEIKEMKEDGQEKVISSRKDTMAVITVSQTTQLKADPQNGKALEQRFIFNKSTGKKITLANPASSKYPGDGAFTLVNGVQNTAGMKRAKEFLGFDGTDCVATIDLGKTTELNTVTAHFFHDEGSWIWKPSAISIMTSADGKTFKPISCSPVNNADNIVCSFSTPVKSRFLKVTVKNQGLIPDGKPGAGHKPWLFVDEIEVN